MTAAQVLWATVGCGGTLLLYVAARSIHHRARSIATLPIVLTASVLFVAVVSGVLDLDRYETSTRPLSFWLGPATVALAVPLHRQRALLFKHARAVLLAIAAGSISSMLLVIALALLLKLGRPLTLSLLPKSVTTPIAMPIAERLGGIPAVAAAIVVITGILGMAFGGPLLTLTRVHHPIARGLALGTSAHGIGTAKALEEGAVEGAMSGVAMVISGVLTALSAPLLARLLLR